ncbi:protein TolQ [Amphiplicatus metriothermophilus]|uniref:Tol-Pal system protein TolQ n=1 Tax=Amphiplicatus metriothermophilus TaxID=1519374 RepID=A0A239PYM3_9PROT|nr:protein TolQ [Amphiplicatus metriothermophilus]MBB5518173.1 biopolymer transport protein TolQ [Amphiplicatus metriothermophilus]SNT75335.1 Cell division and transport-associated protein TolQ [Amphiplicatus metriothermophilus]
METDVAIAAGAGLGGDFSLWSLFLSAGLVVKAVMGILAVASVWSWAIIIDKSMLFGRLKAKSRRFEDQFWSGRPLDELHRKIADKLDHPMARVFAAGMGEWGRAKDAGRTDALVAGAKQRIEKVMNVAVARELEAAERNLGTLATIGSAAPFVGLFGTVWGIMTSFQAIAATKDTNLAVVAPGIAEALFATALGLLAAIPAVVGYNRYSAALNSFAVRLQGFADEFAAILSRQLDERAR